MENWAFGVGLFVGTVVALSAVWVFLKKAGIQSLGHSRIGLRHRADRHVCVEQY